MRWGTAWPTGEPSGSGRDPGPSRREIVHVEVLDVGLAEQASDLAACFGQGLHPSVLTDDGHALEVARVTPDELGVRQQRGGVDRADLLDDFEQSNRAVLRNGVVEATEDPVDVVLSDVSDDEEFVDV